MMSNGPWTGPGFVDAHSHILSVAAEEEQKWRSPDRVAAFHREIQRRGLSPTDVPRKYSAPDLDTAFFAALTEARSLGIVEIHEAAVGDWEYVAALARLRNADRLPVRLRLYLRNGIADLERMRRFGDDALELAGVKFYADGWLGPHTCALHRPFDDDSGNDGILFHDADVMVRQMEPYASSGWQLITHAIGDRAIDTVLDVYQRLYGEDCRARRPRIEHAQITNPEIVARIAEMGVVVCLQPSFAVTDAGAARAALGDRFAAAYDWQGMHDAGVRMIAGSDYPIETQDPLAGLQRLITGTESGPEPIASRLDPATALRVMTRVDAGTVTLSADPLRVDAMEIAEIAVLDTAPRLH